MADLLKRRQLESALARRLGKLFALQQRELLNALGDPPDLAKLTPEFWESLGEAGRGILQPALEQVYVQQVEQLIKNQGIGVQWDIVNQRAADWARTYSYDLVKGITDTSRQATAAQVEGFFTDKRTMQDVRDALGRLYGPVRAEMIASTEITRAASQGEAHFAEELRGMGLRTTFKWQTNNDERVCPICGPRHNKLQGDGWNDLPPAHPRCRCWVNTVVIHD